LKVDEDTIHEEIEKQKSSDGWSERLEWFPGICAAWWLQALLGESPESGKKCDDSGLSPERRR
jgi:hypothetical protein